MQSSSGSEALGGFQRWVFVLLIVTYRCDGALLQIGAGEARIRFAGVSGRHGNMRPRSDRMERTCSAMAPFASYRTCPFADHVHCFAASDLFSPRPRKNGNRGRLDPPFYLTAILLDNVVEVKDDATATSLAECMSPLQSVNDTRIRRVRRTVITTFAKLYISWRLASVRLRSCWV